MTSILEKRKNNRLICLVLLAGILAACSSNESSLNKGNGIMQVKVVSLEKCSATESTISLVKEIATEMSVEMEFQHVIVRTPEEAIEHRHIGSPTVQINGIDIDPEARSTSQFGIT